MTATASHTPTRCACGQYPDVCRRYGHREAVRTAVDVLRVDFENARTRVAEARRQLAEAENDYAAAKADLRQAIRDEAR